MDERVATLFEAITNKSSIKFCFLEKKMNAGYQDIGVRNAGVSVKLMQK